MKGAGVIVEGPSIGQLGVVNVFYVEGIGCQVLPGVSVVGTVCLVFVEAVSFLCKGLTRGFDVAQCRDRIQGHCGGRGAGVGGCSGS